MSSPTAGAAKTTAIALGAAALGCLGAGVYLVLVVLFNLAVAAIIALGLGWLIHLAFPSVSVFQAAVVIVVILFLAGLLRGLIKHGRAKR